MSLALTSVQKYPALQFAGWRILFGVYLTYYSVRLLPYVVELYSSQGMVPKPALSYLTSVLPNILTYVDSPAVVYALGIGLVVASASIMVGFLRVPAAAVAWFISTEFFGRNVFTEDPTLAFVGLLLVLLIIIPTGEPLSLDTVLFRKKKRIDWYMPAYVYWGAWFVLATAFTVSGTLRLLASVSWQDGTAMLRLYELPIAYHYWFTDWLRSLPLWAIQMQTWLAVGVYILSLPLMLHKNGRVVKWALWVSMFLFVLVTLDLTQVTLGMLLYFLFLFDPSWVPESLTRWWATSLRTLRHWHTRAWEAILRAS